MISLSGHVMINTYFNKYRGIAIGIVASGAGVGVFTMSTLPQHILEHYSWRGTLLIYSACILHVCISACLMRPLKYYYETKEKLDVDQIDKIEDEKHVSAQQTISLLDPNMKVNTDVLDTRQKHSCLNCHLKVKGETKGIFNNLSRYGMSMPELSQRQNEKYINIEKNALTQSQDAVDIKSNHVTDVNDFGIRPARHHLDPIFRKDIFYSGSIYNLKEFKEAGSVGQYVYSMKLTQSMSSAEQVETDGCNKKSSCFIVLRF